MKKDRTNVNLGGGANCAKNVDLPLLNFSSLLRLSGF